jgi:hypothetical protein
MAQLYAKKTSDGLPKALECTDEGLLKVDTELTVTIDPTGLATETTLDAMATDIGTMQTDLATVTADIALMRADLAAILAILGS